MDSTCLSNNSKPTSRDYKCPCGKTYLSYAALFTHIKQKHHGKAPGEIERPRVESRPRGRPPLNSKPKPVEKEKDREASRETDNTQKNLTEKEQNKKYRQAYEQVFQLLQHILYPEEFPEKVWEQVDSFKKLQQFIDKKSNPNNGSFQASNLGYGLSEFLQSISVRVQPYRFQQILLLFMLLLQYVMDQMNNPHLIEQSSFMNPFINWHIEDFAQYLQIESLWIMKKVNMHNIFMCFYNWLKWKQYTTFCITLID